ncbi:MAG: hypothetical protein JWL59_5015 [Chthoniobacteraceae bacterium]|nr:hypothetical protein [Chthoniobacteraceae bacterium]
MSHRILLWALFAFVCGHGNVSGAQPAPSPADNPLKGLVPYSGMAGDTFPHSMEFDYLPLSDLMKGAETFDWEPLEALLSGIASRGNQAILRVWLEYPGRKSGMPKFLRDQGVKVTQWKNDSEKPPADVCYSPDYADERLVGALESFVAALGQRYDGDPRIAYLTAGLLGSWGEWHTWPREDLFASVKTQQRVLAAYERALKRTPVLLRYPAGEDHPDFAANAKLHFGYHDDSFAWGTLDIGKESGSWFYMRTLKAAGESALNKWRTQPIGGEVRPEVWGQVHDAKPEHPKAQDFAICVEQTHVSWLMESGLFEKRAEPERYRRAIEHVRHMGYDFHVPTATIIRDGERVKVWVSVINQGVAPFYQDWRIELAALDLEGRPALSWPVDWKITGLFPGNAPREWNATLNLPEKPAAQLTLALRIINPLPGGKPLRFANAEQERDAPGWLSLGPLP